jgi:hypothetical protein
MFVHPSHETAPTCRWALLIIAGMVSFSSPLSRADEITLPAVWQYDRADIETIKMHTRQILSEPALAPRTTFWQWLWEKFSRWEKPDFHLGSDWAKLIWSVTFIWCVLALLAILTHLIWTIYLLIWPNRRRRNRTAGPGVEPVKSTSFDDLYRTAQALAEKGAFSEAIGVMMVALLRLLDSAGIVRFHESKTNGDYVREYPSGFTGRNEFRKFVLVAERAVYGHFPCDHQTYWQMNSLMECIRSRATRKA